MFQFEPDPRWHFVQASWENGQVKFDIPMSSGSKWKMWRKPVPKDRSSSQIQKSSMTRSINRKYQHPQWSIPVFFSKTVLEKKICRKFTKIDINPPLKFAFPMCVSWCSLVTQKAQASNLGQRVSSSSSSSSPRDQALGDPSIPKITLASLAALSSSPAVSGLGDHHP